LTHDLIVVIDFGSQYNHLITRRLRDLGVYSELWANHQVYERLMKTPNVHGIILSGGPSSVYELNSPTLDPRILQLSIPILGICYGMQLLANMTDCIVEPGLKKEYGVSEIHIINQNSYLWQNQASATQVLMSHGDHVKSVSQDWVVDALSKDLIIASIHHLTKPWFGFQFHPEVTETVLGNTLLSVFTKRVCQVNPTWTMANIIETEIQQIQTKVGKKSVLLGLSGGVDSTVAAVLLHRAIGNQLVCMFVDHGFLREDEVSDVLSSLQDLHLTIHTISAQEEFLIALQSITDPEQKRKIIGKQFIEVFQRESAKLGHIDFLAQGTLYTDIIESGTHSAQTIKSHHNVGGLPKDIKFQLIEPLNQLFKDEVRALGISLGLDPSIVWRQPFPGPGLAIRLIGPITKERLECLRKSDKILREEFQKARLNETVWQYFTVLTGIKSVGVMGDQRTYNETVAIRAVTSVDGMTAQVAKIPYEVLEIISKRIINEIQGINRVVYDITSKPPATIEWE